MCRERNTVSLPPQQKPQEEEAAVGGMATRRALMIGEVRRYSAVERRERVERYRSKRNHLNFKKKITVRTYIHICLWISLG